MDDLKLPRYDVAPHGDTEDMRPAKDGDWVLYEDAAAAVAQERERWIGGVRISIPTDSMEQEIAAHVRRAVAAERERCAKLCEAQATRWVDDRAIYVASECAAAIRATIPRTEEQA